MAGDADEDHQGQAATNFCRLQSDERDYKTRQDRGPSYLSFSSFLADFFVDHQTVLGMGDTEVRMKSKKTVFVTVGTTSFDALVNAVDTREVKEELWRRGYTEILIQMGRGSYIPSKSEGGDDSIAVDYFTFSSSIADHLRAASLVISHAGSGSIFETLRLGKPLIVVVNEDLMDNHQSELAEELADRKHLYCARPQTLCHIIADMKLESLIPYHPGQAKIKQQVPSSGDSDAALHIAQAVVSLNSMSLSIVKGKGEIYLSQVAVNPIGEKVIVQMPTHSQNDTDNPNV
ncbi:hypothetical protein ACLB2K_057307 [Fragaria x ananassa]